ncbi:long-chain-fatty-acid--CoA ligase [Mesorhizobium sp. BAC0120]|uniref:long-chain-fatty-acid--CoA ligase n=1 Tax=Mesorhizobium sp. BAC0120 TaxID=3090670 RepID=UPI00298C35F7|nr:long-chain-fatty-acid--CoA ligase [Mesorhizobium sp. BAC0120]MDW6023377.1 long-chain-fatty-acid--CoA ligase [Mesorhizobium sp. BAC0120]
MTRNEAATFHTGLESPFWPVGFAPHLPFPAGNAAENLIRSATRHPDRPSMHYYGRTYDYAELLDGVTALAGYLQQRCGVRRGDRVLLDMQNSPQFVIAFHAIMRADAVVVPANPMNLAAEIDYLASDSGARVALIGDELIDQFRELVPARFDHVIVARYADAAPDPSVDPLPEVMRRPRAALLPDRFVNFSQALAAGCNPGPVRAASDDIAVMPYSSGTTGRPKACMHLHSAVTFTAAAQAKWYGIDETSVMTSFMPMFHVAGMQASMSAALYAGAALVIMTRWNRDLIPDLFTRHRVTWWSAAPTMIVDVLASDRFSDETFAHLKVLTGGGASMPAAVAERLLDRYGLRFCEGYGLTETISATHINPVDAPKPQCLGLPIFDTTSLVVDPETMRELPLGEVGEILVAGPQVMAGYWQRPEASAEALVDLGGRTFLRTGDLGYVDDEGYYFIVDRLKRMINVSGYKVWPAECEMLLYRHPGVHECCVISAPDPYRGETVKALISLKPEYRGKVSDRDVADFARTVMSAYKVPRIVEFVDSLPRSASNKIDWRRLQEVEWSKPQ